jgi:hypothetical protein
VLHKKVREKILNIGVCDANDNSKVMGKVDSPENNLPKVAVVE